MAAKSVIELYYTFIHTESKALTAVDLRTL